MAYRASDYPPFAVTVDLVILTIGAGDLRLLAIERGADPYKGALALPGGFVHIDEDLATAARRELDEETGVSGIHLEQLGTYGAPDRDPRMRVVSVAYVAFAAEMLEPQAGSDAAAARWYPVSAVDAQPWAFDHRQIIDDGLERVRAKLEYTTLAASFCPPEFTIGELRTVYETVWGVALDPRNFHRKVQASEGFVVPTGETTTRAGGRPAQLHRRGPATTLHPPVTR